MLQALKGDYKAKNDNSNDDMTDDSGDNSNTPTSSSSCFPKPCEFCTTCNLLYTKTVNITINANSTNSQVGETFLLLDNNKQKILCLKNISFSYNPISTRGNQGTIYLNVYLKSTGPTRSLLSVINPLCDPFRHTNIIFRNIGDCFSSTSNGCQLQPNDQVLLQVVLFDQPFLNYGSLVAVSSILTIK